MRVPEALNPEFAKFLREVGPDRRLPLAIRRFMTEVGHAQPVLAMQFAAGRVIDAYEAAFRPSVSSSPQPLQQAPLEFLPGREYISVQLLCELLNVGLVGAPARHEPVAEAAYRIAIGEGCSASVEFLEPRPIVRLPHGIGWQRGRVAAAHEIGHVLIHKRAKGYDAATIRLGSSPQEEVLAEYAARLLLVPKKLYGRWLHASQSVNYAQQAVKIAKQAQVSLHTATARLGDPDVGNRTILGAILWRNAKRFSQAEPVMEPHWHLCPGAYVPVGRCTARRSSLTADLALGERRAADSRIEQVSVGTLQGTFRVDAFAWGSTTNRTRAVLSVFRSDPAQATVSRAS